MNQFDSDNTSPSKGFVAATIEWSVNNRAFMLMLASALFIAGIISVKQTPLDAIPDLSDTQVIIRTDWAGQAPQIIEDSVTYPLTTQMLGLPNTKVVRGFSMFGTSFVYIIFEDNVDLYWARSRVLESLSQIQNQLPNGVTPQLGPDATGVGWVYQYALYDKTGKHDLAELRSIQDWFIRYELTAIDGVAEVASVGGFVKETQVLIDPNKLRAYNIPLNLVIESVRSANQETGGRTIEMAETEYLIRSFGYIEQPKDLKSAVLKSVNGTPITIGDVARVIEGPAMRRGLAELNGEGEVVGGIVVMRPGKNALNLIEDIEARFTKIKQGLPEGVEIKVVYDRSTLIKGAVTFLSHKLIEESIIIALVTLLFLLHLRSAIVAIITIPLGILSAFIIMNWQGITANIMSLGGIAIAIGAMVDASIVMVENAHRKLSEQENLTPQSRKTIIIEAIKDVGPGIFFSLLIITASFLPVFALTGQSERLFSPLAFTKTYSMAASALLSITIVPVLMLWLLKGKIRDENSNPINRFFVWIYRPILSGALKWRKTTLAISFAIFAATFVPLQKLGTEFMPPLYEGNLLYMPMTLPGVSLEKARDILQITNNNIMEMPEVAHVFGKAGRADTATDPAPLSMIETWIELKPQDQWREGVTPQLLITELDKNVRLPGMVNSWGYPIKIRLDMLTTGIRTPIGIKIMGDNLNTIDALAQEIETMVQSIPGTRSAIADRVVGGKYLEIHPNRRELARFGISLKTFQLVIQTALGGMRLDEIVSGRERYPLIVRYDRAFRENANDLENVLIPSGSGAHIPLADVAEIKIAEGPSMIKSEDARLNGWVFVDIKQRDLGSYIKELNRTLETLELPKGYSLKLSGQFEQIQLTNKRLALTIPATLFIIVALLYMYFRQWDRTLLIMLSVPFSVVGGIWWLWLSGYNLSVATAVGFIALSGVAVETAIVMLMYIDMQMREHPPKDLASLNHNVFTGALLRLRPKLMTTSTIILGLIPLFLSDGPGADVMRRIALPLVGGMVSTLVLTLVLLPVIYSEYMGKKLKL